MALPPRDDLACGVTSYGEFFRITPEQKEAVIKAKSHEVPIVFLVSSENLRTAVRMWRYAGDQEAFNDDYEEDVSLYVLKQFPLEGKLECLCRFPRAGWYMVKLLGASSDLGPDYFVLATCLVDASQIDVPTDLPLERFPIQSAGWHLLPQCSVIQPTNGILRHSVAKRSSELSSGSRKAACLSFAFELPRAYDNPTLKFFDGGGRVLQTVDLSFNEGIAAWTVDVEVERVSKLMGTWPFITIDLLAHSAQNTLRLLTYRFVDDLNSDGTLKQDNAVWLKRYPWETDFGNVDVLATDELPKDYPPNTGCQFLVPTEEKEKDGTIEGGSEMTISMRLSELVPVKPSMRYRESLESRYEDLSQFVFLEAEMERVVLRNGRHLRGVSLMARFPKRGHYEVRLLVPDTDTEHVDQVIYTWLFLAEKDAPGTVLPFPRRGSEYALLHREEVLLSPTSLFLTEKNFIKSSVATERCFDFHVSLPTCESVEIFVDSSKPIRAKRLENGTFFTRVDLRDHLRVAEPAKIRAYGYFANSDESGKVQSYTTELLYKFYAVRDVETAKMFSEEVYTKKILTGLTSSTTQPYSHELCAEECFTTVKPGMINEFRFLVPGRTYTFTKLWRDVPLPSDMNKDKDKDKRVQQPAREQTGCILLQRRSEQCVLDETASTLSERPFATETECCASYHLPNDGSFVVTVLCELPRSVSLFLGKRSQTLQFRICTARFSNNDGDSKSNVSSSESINETYVQPAHCFPNQLPTWFKKSPAASIEPNVQLRVDPPSACTFPILSALLNPSRPVRFALNSSCVVVWLDIRALGNVVFRKIFNRDQKDKNLFTTEVDLQELEQKAYNSNEFVLVEGRKLKGLIDAKVIVMGLFKNFLNPRVLLTFDIKHWYD